MPVAVRKVVGTTVRTVETLPRQKSGRPAVSLSGFLSLVSAALEEYQRRIGRSTGDQIRVVQQWPKEQVESPDEGQNLALFRVIERLPQNTTNEGQRRPWNHRLIESVRHPEDPNRILQVFRMAHDNVVEFQISSPHGKRANELAELWETFMLAYTWFFKEMGVSEVHYIKRTEDKLKEIRGQEIHLRPIQYFVRTEDIVQEEKAQISEILIHYDDGPALATSGLNADYGIEDHWAYHPTSTGQTEF